ncbi:inositol monophosphatase [Candidatus Woesearchaeota archaeon]|jgi:myo-inositol-1(or 4)-monophosphatase|nr:inositol monophosphatase [Candidatus Woesearchaeota archaeon]MBT4114124.1 inositol monophosphatase [Candidatus Woesearchaeota archaeon]MBT4248433.1 inositol monophosphatase [Candidatus Woesearchaeota archaeon]
MLETAKLAAKEAGKVILKYFNQDVVFSEKEDKTVVSIADEESEQVIIKTIKEKFPDHSINGEETGRTGDSDIVWHVDPLDGTSNFKNKIPFSTVSIGVEKAGKFILGVIYNPFTDELFYAELGNGAYLNELKIQVTDLKLSKGAVVLDASFRDDRAHRKLKTQEELLNHTSKFRMLGSNALQLAELAKGQYVCSISDAIHTYDFAAGLVIIREAGGVVTDQYGNEPTVDSVVIVATNNVDNHGKVIDITKRTYAGYKGM